MKSAIRKYRSENIECKYRPVFSSLTSVDIADVTESAAKCRSPRPLTLPSIKAKAYLRPCCVNAEL